MADHSAGCGEGSQKCSPEGSGAIAHNLQDKMIETSLARIKHKLIVMSGKGGVGKSSVCANLAVAFANSGKKVGLMDVDLHGPSIPKILGLSGPLGNRGRIIQPKAYSDNLKVVSVASLMSGEDDLPTIWRGPIKMGVIRQFISDVQWDDLDILFIDSPPGTGDEPLTVAQTIPDARAIIVTTPQEVALADVRRSINFCRQVKMDLLGLIENMGPFKCPHCNNEIDIFGSGGGKKTAEAMRVDFLGSIPFNPQVVRQCDNGIPLVSNNDAIDVLQAFDGIVKNIMARL
ncbi:MAG: Mrp/NBP35 family ATP-binding protein [Pseudomonadota bacterium]